MRYKNIILAALVALFAISASAQQVTTLYFLENAPMRHTINPAFQPVSNGFINFSPLGWTSLGVGNNSLTMSDIFYVDPTTGKTITPLHPNGNKVAFLNQMRNMTYFNGEGTAENVAFVRFEAEGTASGTFQVRGNTQTVNARFGGGTRYVFRSDASIVAPTDDAKWFAAGDGGFVIDKNGKNVTLNANFGGTGAVTSAGNGTLTVVRSQTASAPLVCEAGTLAVNAGLSVARPVTVKGGATFTVPGTDRVTLADVAFEEGAEFHINELTGVAPIAVAGLTLPEGGAVSLTKNGGFATGVYRILEKTGIAVSAQSVYGSAISIT